MIISYKSVYFLLDRFFLRKSLDSVLRDYSADIFDAAKLFAETEQDYDYLNVMVNKREYFNQDYILFYQPLKNLPITLKKDSDLTILEFAILFCKCDIDISEFRNIVEAQAEGNGVSSQEQISLFNTYVELIQEHEVQNEGQQYGAE